MTNELFEKIKDNLEKYRFEIENFNPLALPIRLTIFPFGLEVLPFDYTLRVIDLESNKVIARVGFNFDGKNFNFRIIEVKIG